MASQVLQLSCTDLVFAPTKTDTNRRYREEIVFSHRPAALLFDLVDEAADALLALLGHEAAEAVRLVRHVLDGPISRCYRSVAGLEEADRVVQRDGREQGHRHHLLQPRLLDEEGLCEDEALLCYQLHHDVEVLKWVSDGGPTMAAL